MQLGDKIGKEASCPVYRKGVSFYILITETDAQSFFLKEREERFGRNALHLGVHYLMYQLPALFK